MKLLNEFVFWGVALQQSNMLFSVTSRRGSMINYLLTYIILIGSLLAADSPRSSVLRTEYGFIDYANRVIVSRGMANISQKNSSTDKLMVIEKNIKFSKGEARSRARENLLDLIKLVHFDSRTVGEIMVSDKLIESRIKTLVGSAYQQGEIEYLERNEVAFVLV